MSWIIIVFEDKQIIWTYKISYCKSCSEHNINCHYVIPEAIDILHKYVAVDGKVYLACKEDDILGDQDDFERRVKKYLLFTVQ